MKNNSNNNNNNNNKVLRWENALEFTRHASGHRRHANDNVLAGTGWSPLHRCTYYYGLRHHRGRHTSLGGSWTGCSRVPHTATGDTREVRALMALVAAKATPRVALSR